MLSACIWLHALAQGPDGEYHDMDPNHPHCGLVLLLNAQTKRKAAKAEWLCENHYDKKKKDVPWFRQSCWTCVGELKPKLRWAYGHTGLPTKDNPYSALFGQWDPLQLYCPNEPFYQINPSFRTKFTEYRTQVVYGGGRICDKPVKYLGCTNGRGAEQCGEYFCKDYSDQPSYDAHMKDLINPVWGSRPDLPNNNYNFEYFCDCNHDRQYNLASFAGVPAGKSLTPFKYNGYNMADVAQECVIDDPRCPVGEQHDPHATRNSYGRQCSLCPLGQYKAVNASVIYNEADCKVCTDGKFTSSKGSQYCMPHGTCNDGQGETWSAADRTTVDTTCSDCPVGKFSADGKRCVACTANTFANTTGLSECFTQPDCPETVPRALVGTKRSKNVEYSCPTPRQEEVCGVLYRCCGPNCIGFGDATSIRRHDNATVGGETVCCDRFPFPVVGTGQQNMTDEGTIEGSYLGRSNVIVRRRVEIGHKTDAVLQNRNPRAYWQPGPNSRMKSSTDPRCTFEVCLPGPCVFLDMQYAGHSLANAGPEISDTNKEPTGYNFNGTTYHEHVNISELTFVDGETYCNPLFGSSVVEGSLHSTGYGSERTYEEAFLSDKAVSAQYDPLRGTGAIVPITTPQHFPDHYYVNGADGRLQGGQIVTKGQECDSRSLPAYLLPPLCTTSGNRKGTTGCTRSGSNAVTGSYLTEPHNKHTVYLWQAYGLTSNHDRHWRIWRDAKIVELKGAFGAHDPYSNTLFTLADKFILNGNFVGFDKDNRVVNRNFYNYADPTRVSIRPGTDFAAYLYNDPQYLGVTYPSPEGFANSFFTNTRYSMRPAQWGINGYLMDKRKYQGAECSPTVDNDRTWCGFTVWSEDANANADTDHIIVNSTNIGKFPHYMFDDTVTFSGLRKRVLRGTRWNKAIDKHGLKIYMHDVKTWYTTGVTVKYPPPATYTTPGHMKDPPECSDDNSNDAPLCTVRGSGYDRLITSMFTPTGMMHIGSHNTAEYYHPMFRPVRYISDNNPDTSCVYNHVMKEATGENITDGPANTYQGTRGYCYVDAAPPYAMSIVSLLRAAQVLLSQDPEHDLFVEDSSSVHTAIKDYAAAHHTPEYVSYATTRIDGTLQFDTTGPSVGRFLVPGDVVGDTVCDLSVCDIGVNGGSRSLADHRVMCMAQGAAIVSTTGKPQAITDNPVDIPIGQEEDHVRSWYRSDMLLRATYNTHSITRVGQTKARSTAWPVLVNPTAEWLYINQQYRALTTPVDYRTAVGADAVADAVPQFVASSRDAGYQHDGTIGSTPCSCDSQPIVFLCNLDKDPAVNAFYRKYGGLRVNAALNKGVFQVSRCSYSWAYSPHGPDIGLYMPSTRRNVEVVERDVMRSGTGRNGQLKRAHDVLLGKGSPAFEEAVTNLVYNDTKDYAGTDVSVYKTMYRYSCMRYPHGMIHRHQMTENLSMAIFKGQPEGGTQIMNRSTLAGYCEPGGYADDGSVKYLHCPQARQTPAERAAFCTAPETQLLATHIMYGLKVTDITAESSCSKEHKVCVVVSGAAENDGLLSTYTGGVSGGIRRDGYTLLVVPFNATFVRRYTLNPALMPLYASKEDPYVMPEPADDTLEPLFDDDIVTVVTASLSNWGGVCTCPSGKSYRVVDTYNCEDLKCDGGAKGECVQENYYGKGQHVTCGPASAKTKDDADALMESTFGYRPGDVRELLYLLADVSSYITASCADENPVDCIAEVVTAFVDITFAESRKNTKDNCWYIPDMIGDGLRTRECVRPADILLPLTDVMTSVMYKGITIQSAYQRAGHDIHPVVIGGVPVGAKSCERFLVSSSDVTLMLAVDQRGCDNFDSYKRTPVKVVGREVESTTIAIAVKHLGDNSVAVAVLGSDTEVFNAPTVLSVAGLTISVFHHEPGAVHQFDVAAARVVHASEEKLATDFQVQCTTACEPQGTPAHSLHYTPGAVLMGSGGDLYSNPDDTPSFSVWVMPEGTTEGTYTMQTCATQYVAASNRPPIGPQYLQGLYLRDCTSLNFDSSDVFFLVYSTKEDATKNGCALKDPLAIGYLFRWTGTGVWQTSANVNENATNNVFSFGSEGLYVWTDGGGTELTSALQLHDADTRPRGCRVLLQGVMNNALEIVQPQHSPGWTAKLKGGTAPCLDALPNHNGSESYCQYVNVTRYTGIFGIGYMKTEFPRPAHHHVGSVVACVLVGTLLAGLVLANVVLFCDSTGTAVEAFAWSDTAVADAAINAVAQTLQATANDDPPWVAKGGVVTWHDVAAEDGGDADVRGMTVAELYEAIDAGVSADEHGNEIPKALLEAVGALKTAKGD